MPSPACPRRGLADKAQNDRQVPAGVGGGVRESESCGSFNAQTIRNFGQPLFLPSTRFNFASRTAG